MQRTVAAWARGVFGASFVMRWLDKQIAKLIVYLSRPPARIEYGPELDKEN